MSNEELVKQIQSGSSVTDAMEQLYINNLSLIRIIIRPYTHYEEECDLLQQAYFGLLEAVKRYETSENVKFMTYAAYWIRQAVQKYIDDSGSCVRYSYHFNANLRRYKKYVEQFITLHGKIPDMEQIGRVLGVSAKQIEEIQIYSQEIASLDAPTGENADGEEYSLNDVLADNTDMAAEVTEQEYKRQLCRDVNFAVETYLPEREKNIIRLTFWQKQTLKDISESMGISANRVNQLQVQALDRLRKGKCKQLLEQYADTERHIYRNSFGKFKQVGSTVEITAIKRIGLERAILKEISK